MIFAATSDIFWQALFTALPVIIGQIVVAYRLTLESRKTTTEVKQEVAATTAAVQKSIDYNTEVTARAASSAATARDAAQKAHQTLVKLVEKNDPE